MNKKPFYKSWWFWLSIVALLLCVGNILLAHLYKTESANIFTAVSGWVSGIATIVLGVVAVVQNRKYKEENDRIITYQRQRDWLIEQKDLIKANLDNIIKCYADIKEYQYSKLINERTIDLQNHTFNVNDLIYDEILNGIKDYAIYSAVNSYYYFEGIEELVDTVGEYTLKLRVLLKQFVEAIKKKEVDKFNEITELYKILNTRFNEHIFKIQLFISIILTDDNPDDLKKELEDMRNKQLDWIDRMKKAKGEVIKKWAD